MPENNNIKNYSAADIERYHKGQMSPGEMHAMEKAALDDSFLADAMEGYKDEGVNTTADISFLQEKLKQRISGTKIVELKSNRRQGWWKAAASVIIIAGAGIFVYQFAINKRTDNVAKVHESKQDKAVSTKPGTDSSKTNILTNSNDVAKTDKINITADTKDVAKADKTIKDQKIEAKELLNSEKTDVSDYKSDTVNSLAIASGASVSKVIGKDSISNEPGRNLARSRNSNAPILVQSKKAEGDASVLFDLNKYSANTPNAQILHTNVFRGQVLDVYNNALPFANITSTRDKIGTYADAKGYFILTSASDSILNVQIKSVGYENSVVSLRNDLPKNQVILQEDTKNLNEIVIVQSFRNRKKKSDMKVEEPEPEDGWENYDIYIVNNLNKPDEIQIKSPGTRVVEISFNVNKAGEPVKIKVEKSLCKECDIEAIRLLKDGPKWKSKGKTSRATVTVPF